MLLEGLKQGIGGERGIRTLDTLFGYNTLAGCRLQPLGHLPLVAPEGSSFKRERMSTLA